MLRKVASATEKQTMNRDPQKTSSGLVSQGAVIMANGKLLATRDVSRHMRCIHLLSQPPWNKTNVTICPLWAWALYACFEANVKTPEKRETGDERRETRQGKRPPKGPRNVTICPPSCPAK